MVFLGVSSRDHVVSGGSGAAGWSGSSFGVQGTSTAQFLVIAYLLKQFEQLMAKTKTEKSYQ